jgi:four helix bundle protein
MPVAFSAVVNAKNFNDLLVYRKAVSAADAVSALLTRPGFSRDFNLRDQLSRSSSRVGPLILEGFGQLTDRHLATYLGRARGSVLETLGHLSKASSEQLISREEFGALSETYDHVGRMLTRWINYLQRTDWKQRR